MKYVDRMLTTYQSADYSPVVPPHVSGQHSSTIDSRTAADKGKRHKGPGKCEKRRSSILVTTLRSLPVIHDYCAQNLKAV